MKAMAPKAAGAAALLSGLANPHRLLILCALVEGERSVGALIGATGIAPTSMSQHLNKLKEEGIVAARREHRTLFYTITHPAARDLMAVLHAHFCGKEDA
ncbi:transcriptional regulator [Sphingomonas sp. TDK1]|nr:transcriptional regulator [Sphingomonas sp. TDK1]